ncbi:MAG TPA: cation:proton antiporter [Deltaproteobacteria bacterium]|nr:cation:proton antiporter [Deltaproteobacteria bacterium]HQB39062.1 cation:proton antiporter [Deltaproteobacteria bacterium]
MIDNFLLDIEILFGIALVMVILFRTIKMPSIIGFLASGILAGPHALGLIREAHQVEQLAELGVILLLFTIGIELSIGELMRIRSLVLIGGGAQVGVTMLVVMAAVLPLGFSWNQGIFFGSLVALSSTAIVIKLLMDAGQIDTPQGKIALGILIFQDLCIVPLMLLTPLLAGAVQGWLDVLFLCVKAVGVVLAVYYGCRVLMPWLFGHVVATRSRELFIMTIIVIGFGTAWLTSKAGLSLALGAFIAGLAISESDYSHQAVSDLIPFREAFMSLFFISVGMLLDPSIFIRQPLVIIAIVAAILVIKLAVSSAAVVMLGIPGRIAIISALSLAQIGEFSFVLSMTGLQYKLLSPELYQLFLAASIVTMGLTPLLINISPALADRLAPLLPNRFMHGKGSLARSERKRKLEDHVIIVGYGLNGRNLSKVLKHHKLPYVAIETNPFTVTREKKRGEKIIFGDATNQEILSHACITNARVMVVAISDAVASRRVVAQARRMSKTIRIIVRTRYVMEVEPLYKLGVDEVIPEEFETSVEIMARVLKTFLIPQNMIEECVSDVRRDGYEMLRSISRRHSHAIGIGSYLSGAEIATFQVVGGALLQGQSLREGTLRSLSGATILAIKRGDEMVPNPDPVWQLATGDTVLVLGTPQQLRVAATLFEAHGEEKT